MLSDLLGRDSDYLVDPETGCWEWLKTRTKHGYAIGHAHRKYWERVNGELPEGWHVHHLCKNRACVNPDHLQALSSDEHFVHHFLTENGLTLDDVREARRLGRDTDVRTEGLAKRYGVSDRTIRRWWTSGRWARLLNDHEPIRASEGRRVCAREDCDEVIPPERRRHARYCSTDCRVTANWRRRNRRIAEANPLGKERE